MISNFTRNSHAPNPHRASNADARQDKTAKKINFDTFVEAVELIAEKLGKSKDDVILTIVSAKGPT